MRRFIRHPTDIPIEVLRGDGAAVPQPLRDVSHGGLSFRHEEPLPIGAVIRMRIALTQPAFETEARVIWCLPEGKVWQVGVQFLDPEDQFRARRSPSLPRSSRASSDAFGPPPRWTIRVPEETMTVRRPPESLSGHCSA